MARVMQNYKPQSTIKLHKEVRFHPQLTHAERLFLAEIQAINEKGKCYFSSRSLCEVFNVSHQTIINWVRKLADLGLVEVGVDTSTYGYKKYLTAKNKN